MGDRLPADEPNPWRTLTRREVYGNPWIRVEEHDVLTPAGTPGLYGVVHARHLALGVVPVDEESCTWLVGQYRYTLGRYSWEIPEGGGDPARDPLDEARRELAEETGLRADHWEELLVLHTSNCFTDEAARVYLATGIHQGQADPEPSEKLRVCRLPLVETLDLIEAGRITDAISVAALQAAVRRLDRGA